MTGGLQDDQLTTPSRANVFARSSLAKGSSVLATTIDLKGNGISGQGANPVGPIGIVSASTSGGETNRTAATRLSALPVVAAQWITADTAHAVGDQHDWLVRRPKSPHQDSKPNLRIGDIPNHLDEPAGIQGDSLPTMIASVVGLNLQAPEQLIRFSLIPSSSKKGTDALAHLHRNSNGSVASQDLLHCLSNTSLVVRTNDHISRCF